MIDPEAPQDIVRPTGITDEVRSHLQRAHHKPITITIPGEIITDANGVPIGVEPSITVTGTAAIRLPQRQEDDPA